MWISNCVIVLPDTVLGDGAVRVQDGVISEIRDQPVAHPDIEAGGLTMIPGMIDLHGDMLERELQPRPGALFPIGMSVAELDKRHAAAGVTTAYAAIAFDRDSGTKTDARSNEFSRTVVTALSQLKPTLLTDLLVHARFEVDNDGALPVLADLIKTGQVHMVSLMDHTPGQGQYRDVEQFVKYRVQRYGISADQALDTANFKIGDGGKRHTVLANMHAIADLARRGGLPIASHDDDTAEKIALMRELGVAISEFPISLGAAHEARRQGLTTLMGAPNALRGVSNSGNLSAREALASGALDGLASDYHPGTLLQAAVVLEREGLTSLNDAFRLVTAAPATAAGLTDRGTITVGKRADLALVARGPVPRVSATLVGGTIVYAENAILFQRAAASA